VVLLAESSPDESRTWQDRLVESSNVAQILSAAQQLEANHPDRAIELYQAAAELGDAEAKQTVDRLRSLPPRTVPSS
jgi:hypothetical protein